MLGEALEEIAATTSSICDDGTNDCAIFTTPGP